MDTDTSNKACLNSGTAPSKFITTGFVFFVVGGGDTLAIFAQFDIT